jgi:hypothetical protein
MKETSLETRTGEKANKEAKQMNQYQSEFLARLALVGELQHLVAGEQVEPWLLFGQCKK